MSELEELPLYVPDDRTTRRGSLRARRARNKYRPIPRILIRVDHGEDHGVDRSDTVLAAPSPMGTNLLSPPPEEQIGHLSNFAFLRQVWVPPDVAVAAFDSWRACTPVVRARHSRLSFGADLKLTRPPVAVLGAEPLRALSGRLHVAHWPLEVAIEMYLLPWNAFRTVVDLRPRGRRWPALGVPMGAYFSAGHAVLDLVVAHLDAR